MTRLYGSPSVELDDDQKTVAASLLWLLRGNAAQRVILAWHFAWKPALEASGTGWQAPYLAQLLIDPYAGIRFVAKRALASHPNFADLEYDFVGPEAERDKARKLALEKWVRYGGPPPKDSADAVLFNADGQLRQEAVERLLKQRDDTPLAIPQ
jgi:hypothetical protein